MKNEITARVLESIADPPKLDTDGERLKLLENRSVRVELRVGVDQWLEMQDIRKKSLAQLERLRDQYLRTIPRPFNLADVEEALKDQEEDDIRMILTTAQWERLDQLVHYVEIAYVGLPKALVEGNFGREIGVYENQFSRITSKGAEIIEDAELSLSLIRSATHQKILALLPPESQLTAEEVLGSYFDIGNWVDAFRDYRKTQSEELAYTGRETVFSPTETQADFPPTTYQLLSFLGHANVRRELCLTPAQVDAIYKALQRAKEGLDAVEVFGELLLPSQQHRVQQLFHYIELKQSGYATAITVGNVGKSLAIPPQSAAKIRAPIQSLEIECDQQCEALQRKTHERILQMLSGDQRERAEELLGPYFRFIDGLIEWRSDFREVYLRSKDNSK